MNKIDRLKKLSRIESKGTVKFERKLTMMPIGNYFDSRTSFSNGGDHYHHHHVLGCSTLIEMEDGGGGSNTSSRISSMSTEKSMSASKSHSEAERRRRERINAHLATLRTLLPNTTKTDKASLLAEVVQHVKQLKKLAHDAAAKDGHDGCIGEWPFPGETDELTLGYCDESDEESSSSSLSEKRKKRVLIKVTVNCEDRPEFVSDLTGAEDGTSESGESGDGDSWRKNQERLVDPRKR